MKREINFRTGKGMATERRKVFTPENLIKVMKQIGMTDEEIKMALLKDIGEQRRGRR